MDQSTQIVVILILGLSCHVYGKLPEVIDMCLSNSSMCATVPMDCLGNTTNCIAAAFITPINETTFQIDYSALREYEYISLGFSKDKKMGEEVTVDCVIGPNAQVKVNTAYNIGHKHYVESRKNEALTEVEIGIFGYIYCNFQITGMLSVGEYSGPERNVPTYILLALGQMKDGHVGFHDITAISKEIYFSSSASITLTWLTIVLSFISYIAF